MTTKINVIKFETLNGKKTGKAFTFFFDAKISHAKFAGKDLAIFIIIRYNNKVFENEEGGGRYAIRL
jgi:hypothetical protein